MIPKIAISFVAISVSVVLLFIFPTMPNWPFTDVGFLIAWLSMAAVICSVLLYVVSYRYA